MKKRYHGAAQSRPSLSGEIHNLLKSSWLIAAIHLWREGTQETELICVYMPPCESVFRLPRIGASFGAAPIRITMLN